MEIERFKSTPYWDVYAEFNIGDYTYKGKWFKENTEHILFQQKADALVDVITGKQAYVFSVETERKEYKPPRFYNLSSLQEEANKRFKYSPKQTLDFAQSLYEKGYISYPRSSPEVVTEEEAAEFPLILKKLLSIENYKALLPVQNESLIGNKRFVDSDAVDDHHAIIPTDQIPNITSLSESEFHLYDMIVRRLIAAHFPNAIFDLTSIITVANDSFTFLSKGKVTIQEGWRKVIYSSEANGEENETNEALTLPPLSGDEVGIVHKCSITEGKTQPKPRYTLGTLISVMKNAGNTIESSTEKDGFKNTDFMLGTEATRSGIIQQIQKQRYITVSKNQVFLSPKGRILIEALKHSDGILTSPLLTARWEQYLSQIGKGKKSHELFIEKTKEMTKKIVFGTIDSAKHWTFSKSIEEMNEKVKLGNCRLCGAAVIERKEFFGCSAYQTNNCTFTFPKQLCEKTIPISEVKKFLTIGTTSLIKGFKGKKRTFDAFIIWDESKEKWDFSSHELKETNKG
ncbi:type IA DNA topoisomerase [Sutcliffiella cohnii]|uniref:type IA DNA topoisomerase n=1 Tax=Sutcliffiella cohnii TaxID=33932 RepID=UPI00082FF0DA|nr:type IA DNA topoisomerase [Sutcliffiella cohnii]